MNDIMAASGHRSVRVALDYARDAASMLRKILILKDPNQRLGKFHPSHSTGDENCERVCDPCRQWQKPLPELVRGFMEECVKIIPGDIRNTNPKYMFDKVVDWSTPDRSAERKLTEIVESYSEHNSRVVMGCVNQLIDGAKKEAVQQEVVKEREAKREQVSNLKRKLLEILPEATVRQLNVECYFGCEEAEEEGDTSTTTNVCPDSTKKTKKRRGTRELDDRKKFQGMDARERVLFMESNRSNILNSKEFNESDRCFLNRLKKPLLCFDDHCGGDTEMFLVRVGSEFLPTKFTKKGCHLCSEVSR